MTRTGGAELACRFVALLCRAAGALELGDLAGEFLVSRPIQLGILFRALAQCFQAVARRSSRRRRRRGASEPGRYQSAWLAFQCLRSDVPGVISALTDREVCCQLARLRAPVFRCRPRRRSSNIAAGPSG